MTRAVDIRSERRVLVTPATKWTECSCKADDFQIPIKLMSFLRPSYEPKFPSLERGLRSLDNGAKRKDNQSRSVYSANTSSHPPPVLLPSFRPEKMPENAEAVSATLSTGRNCTVEITNVTSAYCLINPKVYMSSGFCHHPPQPTVRITQTEVCSFTKDDDTATGAVGVLTYDLFHMQRRVCSERVAVMFSVPYDYNFYKNWLAVGVFEATRPCDKQLYKHMYQEKDFSNFARSEANGSGLEYKANDVDLRATMSNVGKAIVKLELYDKIQ
ncbi:hypothetical protein DPEC_G00277870 [Dallia pectoralis]|uniref:Uncharacterized protein n=1 Tax=Dallia pectoralis TaxID=75939 RepID=A0ACC2FMC6_DALPE|nr:hypothetical protein DPEC_G00277870 [Dallia pectoralis]